VIAKQLEHLDVVNVGAAGTFIVRRPVPRAELRREFERRLPFPAEIMTCRGREIIDLLAQEFFEGHRVRPDIVRFVSILSRRPRTDPRLPTHLPARGKWMVKVLARDERFVIGLYRRHMKVLAHLGALDKVFGVPITTRSWSTLASVAGVLERRAKEDTRP
jgi:hypothetical protein